MAKSKSLFIILILFSFENGFSQTLTVNQTIEYLNKILKTGTQVSLDNEGYLSKLNIQYTNFYNNKFNSEFISDTTKISINIEDIDEISLYENKVPPQQIEIACKEGISCIKGGYGSKISWSISDDYDAKRFHNAIIYLIGLATDLGYKRNNVDDPFVKPKPNVNKVPQKKITTTGVESKIPLREKSGVFNLTANLNGVTSVFILDSGAGESNISSELEKKLLINGIITKKDYLSNGLYQLADGSIQECRRVKIPKIIVGKKTVYNVNVSIGPSNSPNLLGQSFLKKVNTWTIDNEKKYLILR